MSGCVLPGCLSVLQREAAALVLQPASLWTAGSYTFLSRINTLLFAGTQSMTEQVPSKPDTSCAVVSMLPPATFHRAAVASCGPV